MNKVVPITSVTTRPGSPPMSPEMASNPYALLMVGSTRCPTCTVYARVMEAAAERDIFNTYAAMYIDGDHGMEMLQNAISGGAEVQFVPSFFLLEHGVWTKKVLEKLPPLLTTEALIETLPNRKFIHATREIPEAPKPHTRVAPKRPHIETPSVSQRLVSKIPLDPEVKEVLENLVNKSSQRVAPGGYFILG